jgi:hypothetical protein
MRDKADTAGIMFIARIIKALLRRDAEGGTFRRIGRGGSLGCCDLVKSHGRRPVRHRFPSGKALVAGDPSSRTAPLPGPTRDSAVAL